MVYLDSVICIYAVEGAPSFQARAKTRLAAMAGQGNSPQGSPSPEVVRDVARATSDGAPVPLAQIFATEATEFTEEYSTS